MLGPKQEAQASLTYEFSLDDHVPQDHLLRSIDRFVDLGTIAAQKSHRVHEESVEVLALRASVACKARTYKTHGESMNRRDCYKPRFVADQATQSFADFSGCVAIVCEHQNPFRVFTLNLHEIRNAMHQHPSLPRAWTCEHKHIGLFAVVFDDLFLGGVAEGFYDACPCLPRRLPAEFSSPAGHPSTHKYITVEFEVVLPT